jgi:hypothetical protein
VIDLHSSWEGLGKNGGGSHVYGRVSSDRYTMDYVLATEMLGSTASLALAVGSWTDINRHRHRDYHLCHGDPRLFSSDVYSLQKSTTADFDLEVKRDIAASMTFYGVTSGESLSVSRHFCCGGSCCLCW